MKLNHKLMHLIQKYKYEFLLIIVIGYSIYFNVLFNGFVLDDLFQIVDTPITGWDKIFHYFFNEIGPYYRPLMLSTFTLFKTIGLNSFFYHFLQVSVHIINSTLLFVIFDSIFKRRNLSLFLALVFLVHPIVAETVAYASLLQDTYLMFFGLLGLLLLVKKPPDLKIFFLLPTLQLFSLLSKETAILFIFMQSLYSFMFQRKIFLKQIILSIIVMLIYFGWRVLYFGFIQYDNFLTRVPNTSTSSGLFERIINAPAVIYYYLKTFIFPKDLAIGQMWWHNSIGFDNFYFPLLIEALGLILLIILGIYIYRKRLKDFKLFLFFSIWFILGLGFHSQIITLHLTVADHWFYFPLVGLLGLIGVLIKEIKIKKEGVRFALYLLAIILISLLSVRTVIRNANWYDQITLAEHDLKILKSSPLLELNYGNALANVGRTAEAEKQIRKVLMRAPDSPTAWNSLGSSLASQEKYDESITAYNRSIDLDEDFYIAYSNLSRVYLRDFRIDQSKDFLENKAIKNWPEDAYFWRMLGITYLLDENEKDALKAFSEAYRISPDQANSYYYINLLNGNEVQIRM